MKIIPKASRKIFPDNHQTTGSVGHGSFPFGLSDGPNNSRINQVATVIIIHLHITSYIMIYYVYYPKGPSTRLKPVPLCSLVLPCALKARAQQPSSASRESHACLHHHRNSIAGSHVSLGIPTRMDHEKWKCPADSRTQ